MKETILAAWIEMVSQLIFSWRMASMSLEAAAVGRMGSPVGPKPSIWR